MKNACCASTKIMTKNLNEENEKPILKNDISSKLSLCCTASLYLMTKKQTTLLKQLIINQKSKATWTLNTKPCLQVSICV